MAITADRIIPRGDPACSCPERAWDVGERVEVDIVHSACNKLIRRAHVSGIDLHSSTRARDWATRTNQERTEREEGEEPKRPAQQAHALKRVV